MTPKQAERRVRIVLGYSAGVVSALVTVQIVGPLWTGYRMSGLELAFVLVFFPVHANLNWVLALAPFIVVRTWGGFRNLWISVVGGVATAALTFPIQVFAYIWLFDFEGASPYLPTLITYGKAGWPLIVIGGATGGLVCRWISGDAPWAE